LSSSLNFDLREWLVPPVLLPVFFVLMIAAGHSSLVTTSARIAQQHLSEGQNGQQSNR
jgi:hypothetical protein